jgi:hypothetical protein
LRSNSCKAEDLPRFATRRRCESFIKSLKREEIYANKYENLENLRANIGEFIEEHYNRKRLHSALGYRSPEEFEQQRKRESLVGSPGATVEFVVNDGNPTGLRFGCLCHEEVQHEA